MSTFALTKKKEKKKKTPDLTDGSGLAQIHPVTALKFLST